ncbi:hypothetical protein ACRS6B_08925 [Nocardia asteroides]
MVAELMRQRGLIPAGAGSTSVSGQLEFPIGGQLTGSYLAARVTLQQRRRWLGEA